MAIRITLEVDIVLGHSRRHSFTQHRHRGERDEILGEPNTRRFCTAMPISIPDLERQLPESARQSHGNRDAGKKGRRLRLFLL